ncbi:family 10 glycosylhydrolase [Sedimentisphaera salicampi]|uniref:Glycosyl hydrolase-like 10 domain-containing protein n=1 Tax=Sedimentisphaera salicampi TaxID=1941349 RepID=A0A1W6LQC7_9BACT|nr:family 10 glycosylhydrolase [Sedimentisphaera salicampi]ARN57977.1 hypothetical protein STSP1_02403 [Sedimentisphaera salicampi]
MKHKLLLIFFISSFAFSAVKETEIRAIATHPSWYWKGSVKEKRSEMRHYFKLLNEANINMVYFWMETANMAALLGEPKYAKNGDYNFYSTEKWDCIGEMLKEAKKHNVELHLWFSFTRYKRNRNYVPEYDSNPEIMPEGSPAWASITKSEYEAGYTDPASKNVSGTALCNNAEGAGGWTIEVIDRILQKYPEIAGIHLEEPGYLSLQRCVCKRCQKVYSLLYDEPGENLLNHIYSGKNAREAYRKDPKAIAVKVYGTNRFVSKFRDFLEEKHPYKILMTGGGPYPALERARGRNWPEWIQWGWIPYFGCQAYRPNVKSFVTDCKSAMDAMQGSGAEFAPIIGMLYGSGKTHSNSPEMVIKQIKAARKLDGYKGVEYAGVQLFSGKALNKEMAEALGKGPFSETKPLPWENAKGKEDEKNLSKRKDKPER